jgi:hypothetical protein
MLIFYFWIEWLYFRLHNMHWTEDMKIQSRQPLEVDATGTRVENRQL